MTSKKSFILSAIAFPAVLGAQTLVTNLGTPEYSHIGTGADNAYTVAQSATTAANGFTFEVNFTASAADVAQSGKNVLLMEIGGTANGVGLVLQNGVPMFVVKINSTDAQVPEYSLTSQADMTWADQTGGSTSLRVVGAASSFGTLVAGQSYSIALTWDNAHTFSLGVQQGIGGIYTVDTFTTTDNVPATNSWIGGASGGAISIGGATSLGNLGGFSGNNAGIDAGIWDVSNYQAFSDLEAINGSYWNGVGIIVPTTAAIPEPNTFPLLVVCGLFAAMKFPGLRSRRV